MRVQLYNKIGKIAKVDKIGNGGAKKQRGVQEPGHATKNENP
jgi:hypothetical protein